MKFVHDDDRDVVERKMNVGELAFFAVLVVKVRRIDLNFREIGFGLLHFFLESRRAPVFFHLFPRDA